ncbi:SpoIIE family protein phosphatase [Edaphobacter sp. HDX4]|uniref:SpoIIE family protein phosphatase n=1 Tax=Edaphobacter sp. HDX4 TaxID=2794064 RepID=UPI002FE5EAF0
MDRSSIGEVRRAAVGVAQALRFDEESRSNVGIVATELATNILLHAETGEFLVCPSQDQNGIRLDMLALDSGPGIGDIGRAMEDGFSTVGTAGQGLGAIKRLSHASGLYSNTTQGTVCWSRFQTGDSPVAGVVNLPLGEEPVAGDSYFTDTNPARAMYMMVDGLGHGIGAAEAADEAVLTVKTHFNQSAAEIVTRTHEALKKTRGAAMAIAIVDLQRQILSYAGIGNISASLLSGASSRSLVSQNGTLGAVMPRNVQEFTYPVDPDTMLIMFSDGLTSKASPVAYTGFHNRPAMLLAGLMYRDFSRRRDDASVLVTRLGGSRL